MTCVFDSEFTCYFRKAKKHVFDLQCYIIERLFLFVDFSKTSVVRSPVCFFSSLPLFQGNLLSAVSDAGLTAYSLAMSNGHQVRELGDGNTGLRGEATKIFRNVVVDILAIRLVVLNNFLFSPLLGK